MPDSSTFIMSSNMDTQVCKEIVKDPQEDSLKCLTLK